MGKMQETLVQLVVLLLVVITAAIKSLRFTPSEVTDFELKRQIQQGRRAAATEERLRRDRPLLLALQQLIILLLTILIILCLRSANSFIGSILFALLWLIIAEVLCARQAFRSMVEEMADQYQDLPLRIVDALRPVLRFVAEPGASREQQTTFYSKDELVYAMKHDHGVLTKEEIALICQAMLYEQTKIKDIMTRRASVIAVEPDDTVGPVLLDRLHKSSQSYFPVIRKNLDHVIGLLAKQSFMSAKSSIKNVSDAMDSQVLYVNENENLEHALQAFLRTRRHLFIVVNESEEMTGVIDIEDILEFIVGHKIVDGFDRYEDLRSVAKLAATAREKSNTK